MQTRMQVPNTVPLKESTVHRCLCIRLQCITLCLHSALVHSVNLIPALRSGPDAGWWLQSYRAIIAGSRASLAGSLVESPTESLEKSPIYLVHPMHNVHPCSLLRNYAVRTFPNDFKVSNRNDCGPLKLGNFQRTISDLRLNTLALFSALLFRYAFLRP